MTEIAQPIRTQAAILITATAKATGTLVLCPDMLAHVKSRIVRVCTGAGFAVIAATPAGLAVLSQSGS